MKGEKMRRKDRNGQETEERRQAAWREGQGLQEGAGKGRCCCCCLQSLLIERQGWGRWRRGGDGAAVRGRWRGRVRGVLAQ